MHSLPKRKGRTVIVATASDFPSTSFVLQQAQRNGYELRLIAKSANLQSIDVWADALKGDVICAFLTHVLYNTNAKLAIEGITQICSERSIINVIDVAQSAGIVPIDLSALAADVLVGSCIKWLCGGPGAGFIWANKDLISELQPTDVAWFSTQPWTKLSDSLIACNAIE